MDQAQFICLEELELTNLVCLQCIRAMCKDCAERHRSQTQHVPIELDAACKEFRKSLKKHTTAIASKLAVYDAVLHNLLTRNVAATQKGKKKKHPGIAALQEELLAAKHIHTFESILCQYAIKCLKPPLKRSIQFELLVCSPNCDLPRPTAFEPFSAIHAASLSADHREVVGTIYNFAGWVRSEIARLQPAAEKILSMAQTLKDATEAESVVAQVQPISAEYRSAYSRLLMAYHSRQIMYDRCFALIWEQIEHRQTIRAVPSRSFMCNNSPPFVLWASEKKGLMARNMQSKQATRLIAAKHFPTGAAGVLIDNNLYLCGGSAITHDDDTSRRLTHCLLSPQDTLVAVRELALMRERRTKPGFTCVAKQWLYVIGGIVTDQNVGRCEKFNLFSESWQPAPTLLQPTRKIRACCADERFLYSLGMYISSPAFGLEKLDTADEDAGWSTVAILKEQVRIAAFIKETEPGYLMMGTMNGVPGGHSKWSRRLFNYGTQTLLPEMPYETVPTPTSGIASVNEMFVFPGLLRAGRLFLVHQESRISPFLLTYSTISKTMVKTNIDSL